MKKYINADEFIIPKGTVDDIAERGVPAIHDLLDIQPSADVEPKWIPIKLGMPEDNVPVNITWVNRNPESYYAEIKDKPFTATGVFFKGKWYWYSATIEDELAEWGDCEIDRVDEDIEIVAWMPLPKPYGERKETE